MRKTDKICKAEMDWALDHLLHLVSMSAFPCSDQGADLCLKKMVSCIRSQETITYPSGVCHPNEVVLRV